MYQHHPEVDEKVSRHIERARKALIKAKDIIEKYRNKN
jgi:hypothetical protein